MMKKEIKIAIAVVLSIWFFVMGFELGIYKERKAHAQPQQEVVNTVNPTQAQTDAPTSAPTTIPTTIPTTAQPLTDAPTDAPTVAPTDAPTDAPADDTPSDAPVSQDAPTPSDDPSSMSKAEIIAKMNEYMATLKAEQNVNAHKSENITVNVTDCSVPSAVDMINNIISGLAGSEELDFAIANGASANGDTMYGIIPPTNKDFNLTEAGVVTATAKKSGTDTVYTVVLAEENTTATSPVPAHNSNAIGYLDLASLDLPSVTIQKADMKYPGSTVEITVNADGKVTTLVNKMPMSGLGEAKIAFVTGNASFEGALDEKWTFTY